MGETVINVALFFFFFQWTTAPGFPACRKAVIVGRVISNRKVNCTTPGGPGLAIEETVHVVLPSSLGEDLHQHPLRPAVSGHSPNSSPQEALQTTLFTSHPFQTKRQMNGIYGVGWYGGRYGRQFGRRPICDISLHSHNSLKR